jgi:hypothetical protein
MSALYHYTIKDVGIHHITFLAQAVNHSEQKIGDDPEFVICLLGDIYLMLKNKDPLYAYSNPPIKAPLHIKHTMPALEDYEAYQNKIECFIEHLIEVYYINLGFETALKIFPKNEFNCAEAELKVIFDEPCFMPEETIGYEIAIMYGPLAYWNE